VGQPDVERQVTGGDPVVGGKCPHQVFGVAQLLDALDLGVGPEVGPELEPGLRHQSLVTQGGVGSQPTVEPVALHRAPAGDDRAVFPPGAAADRQVGNRGRRGRIGVEVGIGTGVTLKIDDTGGRQVGGFDQR